MPGCASLKDQLGVTLMGIETSSQPSHHPSEEAVFQKQGKM